MDPNLRALVAAAEASDWCEEPIPPRRRRFSVELDRRGLFLRVARTELYLCAEANGAWSAYREPGGFDLQMWRLHLVVGKVPA
jgi:hypothetical protein